MNSTALPLSCGMVLAALMAAGASHFWSVQNFVASYSAAGLPVQARPELPPPATGPELADNTRNSLPAPDPASKPGPANLSDPQKEFFENLIAEMKNLRTENRDLLDQLAETNRSVMQLEFRVDTHSDSFRPLPVSEERFDTTFGEDLPGVLPPRAIPAFIDD